MFTIGDKVAYPMHGAGVIEGIEEQTILGTPRRYYVLRLSHSDMKVMVPVENSQQVGVRYSSEPVTSMMSYLSCTLIPRRCPITGIKEIGITWRNSRPEI